MSSTLPTHARGFRAVAPMVRGLPYMLAVLLWLAYFWRVFTPVVADQLMLSRTPGTLAAFSLRQATFQGDAPGAVCFAPPAPSSLPYPPALAGVALARALGAADYPWSALQWELTLHSMLAALGMCLLVRSVRGGWLACAVAATAFTFSGFMTAYALQLPQTLEAAAWLPLALCFALRAARPAGLHWFGAMAACLGMTWLAGDAVIAALVSVIGLATLGVALRLRGASTAGVAAAAGLSAILALGFAAPAAAAGWLGASPAVAVGGWQIAYVGISVLMLATCTVALAKDVPWPRRALLTGLGAIAVCVVVGASPVGELAGLLGGGALALLAATGAELLAAPLDARPRVRLRRQAGRWLATAAAAFGVMTLLAVAIHLRIAPFAKMDNETDRLALVALSAGALGGVLRWRAADRYAMRGWGAAALAVLVFELFTAGHFANFDKPFPQPTVPLPGPAACSLEQQAAWAAFICAGFVAFGFAWVGRRRS